MLTESDDLYAALCVLIILGCIVLGTVLGQLAR